MMKSSNSSVALRATIAFVSIAMLAGWAQALTPATVPVREGFDDTALPASVTTEGTVATTNTYFVQGARAVKIDDEGTMTYHVASDANATNVWIMLHVKPVYGSITLMNPAFRPDDAILFGFDEDTDTLNVYSNDTWVNLGVALPTAEWAGFVVHADYVTETWDLYVAQNATYSTSLNEFELVGKELEFNSAYAGSGPFTNLVIQSEGGDTYVDALAVTHGRTAVGIDRQYVAAIERNTDTFTSPPPYQYAAADDRFEGELGDDMAVGLTENAVATFWDGVQRVFTLEGAGTWDGTAGQEVQSRSIYLSTINPASVAFYPLDTYPAPKATDVSDAGWNSLAWTAAPEMVTATQLGFTGVAQNGDYLYVYDPITGISYFYQWYNGAWGYHTAAFGTFEVPEGALVWYLNADGTAGGTWKPTE